MHEMSQGLPTCYYLLPYAHTCCVQVGSPHKTINLVTTPHITTPSPGHFQASLGDADNDSPELGALSSLADAAAIITETGSAGDDDRFGDHDHSSSGLSHGRGL